MKLLFALSSPEYLRFYDQTIALLARRGHEVSVAVSMVHDLKPVSLEAIASIDSRVTLAGIVPERDDAWVALARADRGFMDWVRYLHPRLARASALRARMTRKALPWVLQPLDYIPRLNAATVQWIVRRAARVERAIPPSPLLIEWLRALAPEVVLVSPLVEIASDQVDLVRAAQALGIRVGTLVASWDNLTNKGHLRVATDRVFVWNESQKREAVELHRVEPSRVVVTGAQPFDRWFERRPSRTREAFCREVGLPDERPFVLYTGSSIFIARAEYEMPFVRGWIDAIRAHADPAIRDLGILVRPHPYNGQAWEPERFDGLPGVAVWPRGGYDPIDERNRSALFDSLHHAEAVVGLNTSAMIESAIVGTPVLSVTPPEFAGSQGSTLHFHHLLPENGGFVRTATTLEEHLAQLATLVRNREAARAELARFVGSFIRPYGIDRPATPVLVEGIEQLGAIPAPAPVERNRADRALAVALLPLRVVAPWFPPEGSRKTLDSHFRHWRLELRYLPRRIGRSSRAMYGEVVRFARRVRADTERLVIVTEARLRKRAGHLQLQLQWLPRRVQRAIREQYRQAILGARALRASAENTVDDIRRRIRQASRALYGQSVKGARRVRADIDRRIIIAKSRLRKRAAYLRFQLAWLPRRASRALREQYRQVTEGVRALGASAADAAENIRRRTRRMTRGLSGQIVRNAREWRVGTRRAVERSGRRLLSVVRRTRYAAGMAIRRLRGSS